MKRFFVYSYKDPSSTAKPSSFNILFDSFQVQDGQSPPESKIKYPPTFFMVVNAKSKAEAIEKFKSSPFSYNIYK